MIEDKIKNYIDNYFSLEELKIMKKQYFHCYNFDDTTFDNVDYIKIINLYKKLLNINDNNYRIEVDDTATNLTNTLFKRYVNKDTFVVAVIESHLSLTNQLKKLDPNHIFTFHVSSKHEHSDFKTLPKRIIESYRKSKCNNMFLMIVRVIPGFSYVLDQQLLYNIKKEIILNNIPHIYVLDDAQGIFNIPCDYSIYDAVLATTHTLFPGFHMGLLFTKLKNKIGFCNYTGLKRFYEKFEILNKYKNKANQFQDLLTDYFRPILNDNFTINNNTAPQHFTMLIDNSKLLESYSNELFTQYGFVFGENNAKYNWFRIRYYESIIQDSDKFLQGLNQTKNYFKKLIRYNELDEINLDINNPTPYIDYNNMFKTYFKLEQDFFNYSDQKIINHEIKKAENIFKYYINNTYTR